MTDEFPFDRLLDPSPDEEAWDAYIEFALERLGADESTALSMVGLQSLEAAWGAMLPYEVGLFLVMGVPDEEGWRRWGSDPAAELAEWNDELLTGILSEVTNADLWLPAWGEAPSASEREAHVAELFSAAPQLLPIYRNCAIPLSPGRDESSAESNPVLAISNATVTVRGTDLAAWLHNEFEVPLPMWPETPARWFPFWSELAE